MSLPTRIGSGFQVNSTANSFQFDPILTTLTTGRILAVWTDNSGTGADTDGLSVRAQILTAGGARLGGEFVVNRDTASGQYWADAVALANGGYAVFWTDSSTQGEDASGFAIKSQYFDANGARLGTEFTVNTSHDVFQFEPSVTRLTNGNLVVIWTDDSQTGTDKSEYAIRGQILSPTGGLIGGELSINRTTAGDQRLPEVTALANGRFAVAWTDFSPSAGEPGGYSIPRLRLFNASGTPAGPEIIPNDGLEDRLNRPEIIGLQNGRILVVGHDDDFSARIVAQVYNADGSRYGTAKWLNSDRSGSVHDIALAQLTDGRVVAVWIAFGAGLDGMNSIRGRLITQSGEMSGAEFTVIQTAFGRYPGTTVTALDNNRFAVSWTDEGGFGADRSETAIRGQVFQAGPDVRDLWIESLGTWQAKDGDPGAYTLVNPGTVYLGHTDGLKRQLRIEGASVEVSGRSITFKNAVVYAGTAPVAAPLFTGDFTLDMATMRSTAFTEKAPRAYAAGADLDLAGIMELTFGSMMIEEEQAVFGTNFALNYALNIGSAGYPMSVAVDEWGISPGLGTVGTGRWLTGKELELPLPRSLSAVKVTFADVQAAWDGAQDALYLMGTASASIVMGPTRHTVTIDLSGDTEPDQGIFAPGDKFLRYSRGEGWDIVGSFTYDAAAADGRAKDSIRAWGIREIKVELDTTQDKVVASGKVAVPKFGGVLVTAEFDLRWDPWELDGVKFIVDGAAFPLWGLYVTGGHLGVAGLSGEEDNSVEVGLEFSLGPPRWAIVRGGFTGTTTFDPDKGVKGFESFTLDVTADARLSHLLTEPQRDAVREGRSSGIDIVDLMHDWFGLNRSKLLNFEFLNFEGELAYNGQTDVMTFDVDVELLNGLLTGELAFHPKENGDVTFYINVTGRLPEEISVIGGKQFASLNAYVDFRNDSFRSNDTITLWADFEVFGLEAARGIQIGLDGSWRTIGTAEIPLIGSWDLNSDMDWAVMSASWQNATSDAKLIVITPDGQRLTEAQIARRDDIELVTELNSRFSRSVAVRNPEDGIWDIEVVSPDRLGRVTYEASQAAAEAEVTVTAVRADAASRTLSVDLTASGALRNTEFRLFADADSSGVNGTQITEAPLRLVRGAQTIEIDYADVAPGRFFLYAAGTSRTAPLVFDYAEQAVTLNLLRGRAAPDRLEGGRWGELIQGAGGNDTLAPGRGDDTLDGGAGRDLVSYAGQDRALTIDLVAATARARGFEDRLDRIEDAAGGLKGDRLRGDEGANRLFGLEGADRLDGRQGNDRLEGGAGNDWLTGGAGNDRFLGGDGIDRAVFAGSATAIRVDLRKTGLQGTGEGRDLFRSVEQVIGGRGRDSLTGNAGDNLLQGRDGNDRLAGLAGADTLNGGNGADRLDGGKGNDVLIGGAGADTFVYGQGRDVIRDLALTDRIVILSDQLPLAATATGAQVIRRFAETRGDDLVLDFGPDHRLVLTDVADLRGIADRIDVI